MWYRILKNDPKLHVTICEKYTTKQTQAKRCGRQCTGCTKKVEKPGK